MEGEQLKEGSRCVFDEGWDERKNKPRACKVEAIQGKGGDKDRDPRAEGIRGEACRWNEKGGYGFIRPDDGSPDIFCHRTSLLEGELLEEGARVIFNERWDDRKRKPNAINVEVLGKGKGVDGDKEGSDKAAKPEKEECFLWKKNEACRFGDTCKFAHPSHAE